MATLKAPKTKGLTASLKSVPKPVLIAVPLVAGVAFYVYQKKKAATAAATAANSAASTDTGTTTTDTGVQGGYQYGGGGGGGGSYGGGYGSSGSLASQIANLQQSISNLANGNTTTGSNTTNSTANQITPVTPTVTPVVSSTVTPTVTPNPTPQPTNTYNASTALPAGAEIPTLSPNTLSTNIQSAAQEQTQLQNQAAFAAQQAQVLQNLLAKNAQLQAGTTGITTIPASTVNPYAAGGSVYNSQIPTYSVTPAASSVGGSTATVTGGGKGARVS